MATKSLPPLRCVNRYGNVDLTRQVLSKRYDHVPGKRLQVLCRKLRIRFAEAVVGFTGSAPYFSPIKDGVVVSATSAPRLKAAIAESEMRAREKHERAVTGLSVLAALFTLNRRAKRCRDWASQYFRSQKHGLARNMKEEKVRIYGLKDQILHYLLEEGKIKHGGFHRFKGGNWCEILIGGGYCFHRPCPPQNVETEDRESIESKPKESKEPTLVVAYAVAKQYLRGKPHVGVYAWSDSNSWALGGDDGWEDFGQDDDFEAGPTTHEGDDGEDELDDWGLQSL